MLIVNNEGAKFWLNVLTELIERHKGYFSDCEDAIEALFGAINTFYCNVFTALHL